EGVDGHDFDGGDAEFAEVIELFDSGVKGASASEGADVELVDDVLLEWIAAPKVVAPGELRSVDDLGACVDGFGQVARDGIGHGEFADLVLIEISGGRRSRQHPSISIGLVEIWHSEIGGAKAAH